MAVGERVRPAVLVDDGAYYLGEIRTTSARCVLPRGYRAASAPLKVADGRITAPAFAGSGR